MSDTKKGRGRPKKLYPGLKVVEKLCRLDCTDAEIAAFFGMCRKTIERERKSDHEFNEIIRRGKSYAKLSLRRKQVEFAMDGNPTMLVWLGKQYLGQKDKTEVAADVVNRIMPVPTAVNVEDWEKQVQEYQAQ